MGDLGYYIHCFTHLHRATVNGGAPHKPVLLLSMIDCIERGYMRDERVYITSELVALFKSNWQIWVRSRHTLNFALPFYHMSYEPFWNLINKGGEEIELTKSGSIRSFVALNVAVDFALIDKGLFKLLEQKETRSVLKDCLVKTYFPIVVASQQSDLGVLDDIRNDILNTSTVQYLARMERLKTSVGKEEYQEQVFMRGNQFKREVPRVYGNTCCITGLQIDTALNISMLDACHIVPFSKSHDDTVRNGLALCPNLHRAFDRGLITIDQKYRIVVSCKFDEGGDCSHSLKQFHGQRIHLPSDSIHYPDPNNLAWHNDNVFHA